MLNMVGQSKRNSVCFRFFVYIILDRNLNRRRLIGRFTMMLILVSIAFFVISEMSVWDYNNSLIALDRGDFAYGGENNHFTIWTSVLYFYHESCQSHYRLAPAFLTYSIVFSQFLSNFPSPFFNFPIFALFIALFLINLPISSRRAFDADNIYSSC